MRTTFHTSIARAGLGAGLLLSALAAHAASGYEVTPAQERLVHAGMSSNDVRQALGRAERVIHYRNEPGVTWTYEAARVTGGDQMLFDVDFNANGLVASTDERLDERN